MIQPALFVQSLASGLGRRNTIAIHEDTPVTRLQRRNGRWQATTPQGSVDAKRVMLTVNGHVESFGFFRRRLMHVVLFASMTRPLEPGEVRALGGEAEWGLTPADPMGTTVRRSAGTGGRITGTGSG